MTAQERLRWVRNAEHVSGIWYDGINKDLEQAEANVRLGKPQETGRIIEDSPLVGIYRPADAGPIQASDGSFYYVGRAEGVSGIRYLGLNADLRIAGSNVLFGPPLRAREPQPDSPVMGVYRYEVGGAAKVSLAEALQCVRQHKLADLIAEARADDEGMPPRDH